MRALVCTEHGPIDQLKLIEWEDPVPKEGQVLIDVKAAGINFPDVLMIAGQYQTKTPPPFIPGVEASGVIAGIGPGVEQWQIGDRVIVQPLMGAFAEKCVVGTSRIMPLPEHLDFEQGAGFTLTYSTSYHAFNQSTRINAGETVLVLGAAGGVGVTAVEIAKAMGARVIAAASTDEKLEFARSAGADELINYSNVPLKETAKAMTEGKGVDVVYDPVGGELAQQALRTMAKHGRYLVIGFAAGEIQKFPANIVLLKEASVIGVFWGAWSARNPDLQQQNMSEMDAMVQQGTLVPRVTKSYPLNEYQNAFSAITERRAQGKVILTMD
jgi:NADPH2:quinone reductase